MINNWESHDKKWESDCKTWESHDKKCESHGKRWESHNKMWESHVQKLGESCPHIGRVMIIGESWFKKGET